MRWPWKKFEAIYAAMIKRQARESIEYQKIQMTAALYANTNMDMKENNRSERIKELERHFNKALEIIYNNGKDPDAQEIDWNNPFWAAAKRAYERKDIEIEGAQTSESDTVEAVVEQTTPRRRHEGVDQA